MSSSTSHITSNRVNRSLQRKQGSYFNDHYKMLIGESDETFRKTSRKELTAAQAKAVKEKVSRQMSRDAFQRKLAIVVGALVAYYFVYYFWIFLF